MVKNMTGGNKAKSQARKNSAPRTETLRLPSESDERLSLVRVLYGGGRALVSLSCGMELTCVIRKKFRGRLKRNNCLVVNGLVLVGLREWESPDYKTCDLLEVYAHEDSPRLASALPRDFAALSCLTGEGAGLFDADALFSSEADEGGDSSMCHGYGVAPETVAVVGGGEVSWEDI